MKENVSDFLLRRLSQWGVKRIFGYPGDGINGVFGALNRASDFIDFIQVGHEETAAFMACAHAKFTGEVGVCVATSGPGANMCIWLPRPHKCAISSIGRCVLPMPNAAYAASSFPTMCRKWKLKSRRESMAVSFPVSAIKRRASCRKRKNCNAQPLDRIIGHQTQL